MKIYARKRYGKFLVWHAQTGRKSRETGEIVDNKKNLRVTGVGLLREYGEINSRRGAREMNKENQRHQPFTGPSALLS